MARTLVGVVTSDKPDKSIVVSVQSSKTHPIYKKQYSVTRKFMAHDAKNEATTGDTVEIIETAPLSARKRFALKQIVERPRLRDDQIATGEADAPVREVQKPAAKSDDSPKPSEEALASEEDK